MRKQNNKESAEQTTGATPPNLKLNLGDQNSGSQTTENTPANGQGGRNPDAVGAGHGNQVQDNFTRPTDQHKQTELKPGASPDGTASIGEDKSRNEDVEQL